MNLQNIFEANITKDKLKEASPIALAFIGDAVHTLFVRDGIIKSESLLIKDYHKKSAKVCKAQAQAKKLDELVESLSEEEKDIVRRARNAKTHSKAKNASIEDYKKATAFEALVGYIYLTGNYARLKQILKGEL